jgi:hypothetical protein
MKRRTGRNERVADPVIRFSGLALNENNDTKSQRSVIKREVTWLKIAPWVTA